MECSEAREALLLCDDPGPDRCAPADLAEHLRACAACQTLAEEICRTEQAWRDQPVPPSVEQAKETFLKRLPRRGRPRWVVLRRLPAPRWLAAAAVLLVTALGIGIVVNRPQPQPASDVVERLIDWNLALTQAATPEQQQQIYTEHAASLKTSLDKASLPEGERELGKTLIANASWLAANDDPAAAAERFTGVADQLLVKLDAAAPKDAQRLHRIADLYGRVADHGVQVNLERAKAAKANLQNQKKIERAIKKEAEQAQKLAELLERMPEATQKQIRQALAADRKRQKEKAKAAP
jgi:hypothetical protein